MSRPIEPLHGPHNPPLRVQSRRQGAGIMGGAATVVAPTPAPTSAPKRRRAAPVAPTPPSAASTSTVPPLRPSRALIEHYLRYEGWTIQSIVTSDGKPNGTRWEPPTQAGSLILAIVCSLNDERFVSEALGTLAYAESTGDIAIYQLGILASAERLIGTRSPRPREPWDEGFDAATAGAIATLFILAHVDRARWEATR